MSKQQVATLNEALNAYSYKGELVGALRYGHGHINDTFCIYTQDENGDCVRYILQRISNVAFKNPKNLMENICNVTKYLNKIIKAQNGDTKREAMNVVKTKNNEDFFVDSEDRAWRLYDFIEQTNCLQKAENPEQFYESGRAFGNFQYLLRDYPAHTLHETIERFHDTQNRYELLIKAVEKDEFDRVKDVAKELEFAYARKEDCSKCVNAQKEGILPLRVTHNDTKLNNVMLDKTTGEGICVIDLDTVMPGLSINDFGDSIRYGANNSAEDEQDLSKVNFDLGHYEIYAKGFLEGSKGSLTKEEKEYMPWGAKLMTLECGIRFLTDYLSGDVYFRTTKPKQNLDRARTQFKLVADMESCWDKMAEIISKY